MLWLTSRKSWITKRKGTNTTESMVMKRSKRKIMQLETRIQGTFQMKSMIYESNQSFQKVFFQIFFGEIIFWIRFQNFSIGIFVYFSESLIPQDPNISLSSFPSIYPSPFLSISLNKLYIDFRSTIFAKFTVPSKNYEYQIHPFPFLSSLLKISFTYIFAQGSGIS